MLHLRIPLVKFIEDLSYGRYLRGERDAWDLYTKGICLGLLTGIHLHINAFEIELGLEVLCCVRRLQESWETWDGEYDFIEEEYFELLEELVRHESK